MSYTREDVVEAALLRFPAHSREKLTKMYYDFYDAKGKDEFRKYASVTPEAMRVYKNEQK